MADVGTPALRVIDFGLVTPLRSQTLWHAVSYGVSDGGPATLSFARPSAAYVCLGYHRGLGEVDHEYCRRNGLPVYRRMVGGGPVYLDDGQLFFQISLPARAVSPARLAALRTLLEPAVAAFRAAGVHAGLDEDLEICVGDRKVCGHGAGQIRDAVVVCGNLIQRFDHERAAGILALPDPVHRAEVLRLMRRYVAATPADSAAFRQAMIAAYAAALGLRPSVGELTAAERTAVAELDARFASPGWLAGPGSGMAGQVKRGAGRVWQVKVRAGVWAVAASAGPSRVVASVVRGRVDRARITGPGLNGDAHAAERALAGVPVAAAGDVLARFGAPGRQVAAALAAADGRGL